MTDNMAEATTAETRAENTQDYDGGEFKGHPPVGTTSSSSKGPPQVPAGVADFIKANLRNVLPILMMLEDGAEKVFKIAAPYINQGLKVYNEVVTKLEPYGLNEITTCITGFVMMFFGGFFMTTVAVWEAIVQGGLDNFKTNMKLLYTEYSAFRKANVADDKEDLDNDGIADVLQISNEQFAVRKMLLALRATDPQKISQALHTLYTIFIAVVATLRLQFARTLSLGASIGDQFSQVYEKFVMPQLKTMVEQDYHKWLAPVGNYMCRLIGITIAFRIQRILSTFHTAVKGARTFTRGLTELAERNGYGHLTEGYLDEILSGVLAVMGIYLQLFMWTSMPIIVKLLFFPAFFVESILSMFVNIALTTTSAPVAK